MHTSETRQAMYVQRNNEARSYNHCCSKKVISTTYSECVSVALGNQHALRMRLITLSSVTCPAVQNFSAVSHTQHDFRKKVTEHKMYGLIFSTNFV